MGEGPPPAGGAVERQARPPGRETYRGPAAPPAGPTAAAGPTAPRRGLAARPRCTHPRPRVWEFSDPWNGRLCDPHRRAFSPGRRWKRTQAKARRRRVGERHTSQRPLSGVAPLTILSNSPSQRHSAVTSGAPTSLASAFPLSSLGLSQPRIPTAATLGTPSTRTKRDPFLPALQNERNNLRQKRTSPARGNWPVIFLQEDPHPPSMSMTQGTLA